MLTDKGEARSHVRRLLMARGQISVASGLPVRSLITGTLTAILLVVHELVSPGLTLLHAASLLGLAAVVLYSAVEARVRGALPAALAFVFLLISMDDHNRGLWVEIPFFAFLTVVALTIAVLGPKYSRAVDELQQREVERLQGLDREPAYWRQVGTTRMGVYVTRVESRFLSQGLGKRPPGRTADIGSGSGRLEPVLLDKSATVIATDSTLDDLANMEPHHRLGRVHVGDYPTLPFASSSLDAVVAIEVPAVSEKDWFRGECARVLKPGGLAVISMYNRASYKGIMKTVLARILRKEPGQYYCQSTREQTLAWAAAGFITDRCEGFYWLPFRRDSNSRLIPLFSAAESALPLVRLHSWSPWVMTSFQKPHLSSTG